MWEGLYDDTSQVGGNALCACTREHFGLAAARYVDPTRTLDLVPFASSKRLAGSDGTTVRIRRYPKNARVLDAQFFMSAVQPDLTGHVPIRALPFELAILWKPDLKNKALLTAHLVAASDLDAEDKPAVIHHSRALPPAVEALTDRILRGESDNAPTLAPYDDFDDNFPSFEVGPDLA